MTNWYKHASVQKVAYSEPGRAPSFRPRVTQLCWGGFGLSYKHQALTRRILNDRIQTMNEKQLKRIADAMEEILRLVKKDMENMKEAAK